MSFNMKEIGKKSTEVNTYEIYEQFGHGVMESPYREGKLLKVLDCSEIDAFIIAESMNIAAWGIISGRSSWEEPMNCYRKRKIDTPPGDTLENMFKPEDYRNQ